MGPQRLLWISYGRHSSTGSTRTGAPETCGARVTITGHLCSKNSRTGREQPHSPRKNTTGKFYRGAHCRLRLLPPRVPPPHCPQAPKHAAKWGCIWNRDIAGLVAASGLQVEELSTYHFGTTYFIVASPGPRSAEPQAAVGLRRMRGCMIDTQAFALAAQARGRPS